MAEAAPVGPVAGGTTITLPKPKAPAGTTCEKVDAGDLSSLGLGADGYVYAWGAKGSGEDGPGETGRILVPKRTLLPAGVKFSSLAVGTFTSYAVGNDGHAYSWGHNSSGLLWGSSGSNSSSTPELVTMPSGVKYREVAGGWDFSVGLGTNGRL